jgi:ATP-dependent RNA helicase DDX19/DBP5
VSATELRTKDWGDTPLPGEDAEAQETLEKLGAVSLDKEKRRVDGDLHPADAASTLQLVKGDRLMAAQSWQEVGLRPELLTALSAMRFNRPSKIQAAALPIILGRGGAPKQSFIGQAQSGSGKTGAFVLGFLDQMTTEAYTQAIVVAPTLELAEQIYKDVLKMGKDLVGVKAALLVKETKTPKSKITEQVVVGTPGKLWDLVSKAKMLDLSRVKVFVLDEADSVMTGMRDQALGLRKRCPETAQSLFFSATFPETVAKFAESIVKEPYTSVRLKPEDVTVEEIFQFWIKCSSDGNKLQVLDLLYGVLTIGQSIIFMQHVKSAKWLAAEMEKLGHKVSLLHGQDMEASERLRVMQEFRDGKSNVLITTNVLSRGIDVLSVTMVVNYDLPMDREGEADIESYIHRIGRTGRMGNKGIAVSFVHDERALRVWDRIVKDPAMKNAIVTELKNDPAAICERLEQLQNVLGEENKKTRN